MLNIMLKLQYHFIWANRVYFLYQKNVIEYLIFFSYY